MSRYPDPDKIKHFKIPKSVFSTLNEVTSGFILLYIDDEGHPNVEINADNDLTRLGLTKYAANLFDSIDQIEAAQIRGEIFTDEDGDCECPDCEND